MWLVKATPWFVWDDKIDRDVVESGKIESYRERCGWIDKDDLEAASQSGVYVTNTPGILEQSVAELVLPIFVFFRRLLEVR